MQKVCVYICSVLIFLVANLSAQTSVNPDISAIGDFRIFTHDDLSHEDEKNSLNMTDPSVELNIGGYLNPYARADIVFGWHGEHNAEIEEVYATILRGIPLNANLKIGKYLLGFGRLNQTHPHAYSFIKRPLVHQNFFGDEGLSDMTIRSSFSIPTGEAFTEVMGGLLKGDALAAHVHDDHDAEEHTHKRDLGFFGRVTTSLAVSESSELAFGTSFLNAVHGFTEDSTKPTEQLRSWIIGVDLKYKYKPSKYKSLQIEAEAIIRNNELYEHDEKLKSYGTYGYIDYRFNQKYNVGGIFDWIRLKEAHHHESVEHLIEQHDTKRIGLFAGFAPLEETSLVRLTSFWTNPDEGEQFWEAILQLVVSLGPHKPHTF